MTNTDRIATYTRAGYTHVLYFKAVHNTLGELAEDMIPWCDEKSAHDWVKSVNASKKVDYRVTSYEVRKL